MLYTNLVLVQDDLFGPLLPALATVDMVGLALLHTSTNQPHHADLPQGRKVSGRGLLHLLPSLT